MRDERAYATVVACFAAGLYLALLVAGFGLTSLAANTEVIADSRAGPLIGPAMTGAAVALLLILLILFGRRAPGKRQRVDPGFAFGVATACSLVFAAAGGVAGIAGDPGQSFHYVLFAVAQLGSVYTIVTGLLGFVVALLYQLVLVGRFRQRGRPRWPWEDGDEE
ncbi:hypothetical protein ATY41_00070 [Leifsonia xyli subsp. xyli]|uniref:Uncharacterized protein n=2 Tax=Leifsonia xyli subsp. xyli TaxID=59736 RepID=Q6ACY6_LEIXX|nr:DUF6121 family protein [Leifsonia xyli]AAT89758.1 hypothetical protein Lxx20430 [Leifsonia xyli subsp. xyli str. CTCB07]ODA91140.1 hypothetical protein ATY41_00070 [Leifsonia xyli subsp. xyli]